MVIGVTLLMIMDMLMVTWCLLGLFEIECMEEELVSDTRLLREFPVVPVERRIPTLMNWYCPLMISVGSW